MAEEKATSTYVIPESFDRAVELVREVVSKAKLRITGELNMSGRINRALLIEMAPCVVLFASPSTATERSAADALALTPLHIVVSARGSHTEIHLLKISARADGLHSRAPAAAFGELQSNLTHAIESIGMRASLGA
jgi:uncharacterized protein (DUF302 family)